jgi:two-component system, sensor histidine kinase YesM
MGFTTENAKSMSIVRKIKTIFSDMSLLKKLTLMYAVLILIPAAVAGYWSYRQTVGNLESEINKSTAQTLLQVKNNIDFKVAVAQNIADKIVYNKNIQNFLAKDFEMSPEQFTNYFLNIKPLVSEAATLNQINVYRLSVYTNNDSIPEGWDLFFSSRRIDGFAWYKELTHDKVKVQAWLEPHNVSELNTGNRSDDMVFTFVKKISTVTGQYLGVVTLDVLESEVFSSLNNADAGGETIFATDKSGKLLDTSRPIDNEDVSFLTNKRMNSDSGDFIHGNNFYIYDSSNAAGVIIVIKVPMANMLSNAQTAGRNILLSVFAGFLLLMVCTYFIVRLVFGKMNKIVRVMKSVAGGDFSRRIRIAGKDEIGQLADDFNILIEKINLLMQENIRKETVQKDAQLMALQYQINPHFIYNMIDVFRMKMELAGDYETAGAITDFGKMLRYNINSQSKYATLADELDNVRKYISLQRLRYGNRISLTMNLSREAQELTVVKFILQPIVENSIRHGLTNSKPSLDIDIDFTIEDKIVVVTILDNGGGIDPARLGMLNESLRASDSQQEASISDRGIGLMNINDRMKLFYGNEYFIMLESVEGEYARTILRFPQNAGGKQ